MSHSLTDRGNIFHFHSVAIKESFVYRDGSEAVDTAFIVESPVRLSIAQATSHSGAHNAGLLFWHVLAEWVETRSL